MTPDVKKITVEDILEYQFQAKFVKTLKELKKLEFAIAMKHNITIEQATSIIHNNKKLIKETAINSGEIAQRDESRFVC